jgi:hypothetical protein
MVITIVAGPGEGKSGTAYWLREQLKKLGVDHVVLHDNDTTEEHVIQIRENYNRIMGCVVKSQTVHLVTKQRHPNDSDLGIVHNLSKQDWFKSLETHFQNE